MTISPLNTVATSGIKLSRSLTPRSGAVQSDFVDIPLASHHKRDGYKDSAFRRRVGRHPPLAYSCTHRVLKHISNTKVTVNNSNGFVHRYENDFGTAININATDVRPVTAAEATAVQNSAISNANSSVKGQHYSAFETLYEGKKTVKMITDTVFTVVNAVRQVKKGQFKKAATTLGLKAPPRGVSRKRTLSDNWLEYRYGWIPLYSTVLGEMKRQYDLQKGKQHEYFVSGFSDNTFTGKTVSGWKAGYSYLGTYLQTDYREIRFGTHARSCLVGYTFKITNETLANTTSLGILNPALLAWEALPFSFVADWFVNVSDILDQFDTWNGKQFLHGFITTVDTYDEVRTVEVRPPMWYSLTGISIGYAATRGLDMTRTVLSGPPSVSLQLNPTPLNKDRLLDGISLLKQLFR